MVRNYFIPLYSVSLIDVLWRKKPVCLNNYCVHFLLGFKQLLFQCIIQVNCRVRYFCAPFRFWILQTLFVYFLNKDSDGVVSLKFLYTAVTNIVVTQIFKFISYIEITPKKSLSTIISLKPNNSIHVTRM